MKTRILSLLIVLFLFSCECDCQVPGIGGMMTPGAGEDNTGVTCGDTIYYAMAPQTTMTFHNTNLLNYGQTAIVENDITAVKVRFSISGSPEFNIRAKIYSGSIVGDNINTINNTLLGTSINVIAAEDVGYNQDFVFNFSDSGITGSLSVLFIYEDVVVHGNGNTVFVGSSTSSVYGSGTAMYCVNNGTVNAYATRDLCLSFLYECD